MAGFKVGDQVRLLKLEEWFFKGIPAHEVKFLKSCVGKETAILDFDEYGHAELEFTKSKSAMHFVWVEQSWIEKV